MIVVHDPYQIPPIQAAPGAPLTNTMKNTDQNLVDREREAYALVGRYGGRTTFKRHGKSFMSKIGKQGAKKRWSKPKAKKEN